VNDSLKRGRGCVFMRNRSYYLHQQTCGSWNAIYCTSTAGRPNYNPADSVPAWGQTMEKVSGKHILYETHQIKKVIKVNFFWNDTFLQMNVCFTKSLQIYLTNLKTNTHRRVGLDRRKSSQLCVNVRDSSFSIFFTEWLHYYLNTAVLR